MLCAVLRTRQKSIRRSGVEKVNVIIPTYNRSEFLQAAIGSVLNQSFSDFTLLVVDDASEDDTQSVVNSFNDERIEYIRHQVNCGEAFARNTGISNSSAAFVAFFADYLAIQEPHSNVHPHRQKVGVFTHGRAALSRLLIFCERTP
jgi:cellulose synthase/poly-beta-1,6-N-acetylglucosamine synthase-like glycosyltransferase